MENCLPALEAEVDDVPEMLREQLRACHESTKACFARASGPDVYFETRDDALALGVRLIQASSALAIALRRLEARPVKTV
jgi:hypothetical protein